MEEQMAEQARQSQIQMQKMNEMKTAMDAELQRVKAQFTLRMTKREDELREEMETKTHQFQRQLRALGARLSVSKKLEGRQPSGQNHNEVRPGDLLSACKAGDAGRVRLLLAGGASADDADNYGTTALHFAASLGNDEIITLLLRRGADVNGRNVHGVTPAILAAGADHPSTLSILLEAGGFCIDYDDYDLSERVQSLLKSWEKRSLTPSPFRRTPFRR